MKILSSILLAMALATPSFGQIFWSDHSPAGTSGDIWDVTYANGTFAAVTNTGTLLTSTDGLVWSTQQVANTSVWLVSVTYGNGKWVIVGDGGLILVSTDLKAWVHATSATANKLNGVAYNGSVFLAVGENATVLTSLDAIAWTTLTVPVELGVTGFLHGITWDPINNVFFITGAQTGPSPTFAGGIMMQVSAGSITQIIPPQPSPLEAVIYESNIIPNTVVVGWDTVFSGSYNVSAPTYGHVPNARYRGVAFGNGYYVVTGGTDSPGGIQGVILTSTDGINWTQRFSGDSPANLSTSNLLSVTFSPTLQRFVAVGTGGTILVSNAQPTVFANISTRGYVSSTETFIGGFVIEGTGPRTVLFRADGPALIPFNVAGTLADPVLTVYNSSGTAIATNTGWTTNTNPQAIVTAALEVGAFTLPNPSKDSALLLTLQPGAYTAQVTSASGSSGIVLFEAYTD